MTIHHTKYGKQSYSVDGTKCNITEAAIPHDHFDVDENPDNRDMDMDMCKEIDALIVENHFTKNFGLKRIVFVLH